MSKKQKFKFLLNMQTLVDEFEEELFTLKFYKKKDRGCLLDVQMYHDKITPSSKYVYVMTSDQLPKDFLSDNSWDDSFLIVLGDLPQGLDNGEYNVISLPEETDAWKIYDFVKEIFTSNAEWSFKLQEALNEDCGVSRLCEIAYEHFKNPLFIHDSNFYIIACPKYVAPMLIFEKDPVTGLKRVPTEAINDFKLDEEYIGTLNTVGADMFSKEQRGYRILYMNIWNDYGQYEGRVCIDEIESPLKPSFHLALEYFVNMLMVALYRHNLKDSSYSRPFETFLTSVINKSLRYPEAIQSNLALNNWHLYDTYVCITLGIQERDRNMRTIVSTCNFIEATLNGSYAFYYENNILLIVNLTIYQGDLSDYMSRLSIIIREGLLMAGISNVYKDFCQTPEYHRQAQIALDYGLRQNGMFWQFYFKDFSLQYIVDMAITELTPEQIISNKLLVLRDYDEKNNTNFLQTLDVYIRNERNAMQTSRELFIHRSTLFYRLDRIHELTQLDLDDGETRLYLGLSFYILKHKAKYPI